MQGALGRGTRLLGSWPFWRYGLAVEGLRVLVAWRLPFRPGERWWNWRVETAYGSAGAEVPTTDMVAYLRWRRRQRRARP
ncbi:MAG: hypothetical protein ACE5MI_04185 [Acidimicrobiia bacterium]